MNKKLAVTVLLLAVLCISLAGQVLAQTAVPGVKAGDTFVYSITTQWNTTNSSLTSPPEYLVYNNQTKWFNVSISYVSGANVTSMDFWQFHNGTEGFSRVDMEIENGTLFLVTGMSAFQGFYPANLSVNDALRPLSPQGLRINETISRDYASGKRDTNVVSISYEVTDFYNISRGTETVTYYIDKVTGILVEREDYTEFPDQTGSLTWKLTDTNAWAVTPQAMSLLEIAAIVAVVVIIIVVVVLFIRSRRKHRH